MNENSLKLYLFMTEDIGLSSDSVGMQMCHSINPLHMALNTVMDAAIISLFGVGGYLHLNGIYICMGEMCSAVCKSERSEIISL
jgi:hypothetical protein